MACYLSSSARHLSLASCVLLLLPTLVLAQVPTGVISGRVTDAVGGVMQNATVTITSPSLQGSQTRTTSDNGDYIFRSLPPGTYTVRVQVAGFATAEETVRVAPSETVTANLELRPAGVTEDVAVVTAADTSFINTVQAAASLNFGLVNTLPTARTILSYVNLAPGVHSTGPRNNVSIGGAMSFENLFLVNGAVISENARNEPLDLFIEDALQEVTVATSGISAEYGRFSGGVVNAITKSGGNIFSGSFRTEFENDDWRSTSPFGEPKINDVTPIHSFTLGGPLMRDRLWFFGAGRFEDRQTGEETAVTRIPYVRTFDEQRYEGKITLGLPNAHRLQGVYLHVNQEGANSNSASIGDDVMDLRSLISRRDPMSLATLNYVGTLGNSLAFEGQYSGRRWTIKDAGGLNPDRVQGTPVFDQDTNNSYWAPGFCGLCDEDRHNDNVFVKASYFRSTSAGSHNVIFGYDTFNDRRKTDNRQSSTDYWMYGTGARVVGNDIYPILDDFTLVVHWPLEVSSQGTNFRTHSLFVNDTWAANRHWTLNMGLRWDANRGKNSSGQLVADDSLISPRLGLVFDPVGDGRTSINASYGRYVSALANTVANRSSSAGQPSILIYPYFGPTFNVEDGALVPTEQALTTAFAWFDANRADLPFEAVLPGVAIQIPESLKSPTADEFAVGLSRRLGERGAARIDFVDRRYGNFYADRTDTSTGTITNEIGQVFDLTLVENTNDLERHYTGVTFLGTYRAGAQLDLGASYTLSNLRGSVDGEDVGSGPVTDVSLLRYPEYSEQEWTNPEGDLSVDQRHRFRLWGTYVLPVGTPSDVVTVGLLQQIQSGTPYGAAQEISLFDEEGNGFVANPGYVNPPFRALYYFTDRDAFRTETMYRTDLSLNYQRHFGSPQGFEVFAQFHILNVFNQFQAFNNTNGEINTSVDTAVTDETGTLQTFDPFTQTPVRGVNWNLGDDFGKPVDADAYTAPRTFRFSLGLRF